ncbi:cyclase family protein [Metallosphaera javensis (ex Sakai et al. 2022)]|uniref:cyclase family protein n=1 Tax=Metallosphaera javensis (ex Sakai et al. 2022) TaxID=2775498 RepID=UPI0030849831|nr:MAG: cyclase [Metallosphaera javensis (ex Sakai et al. 2022)]
MRDLPNKDTSQIREFLRNFEYYDFSMPLTHNAIMWPTMPPIRINKIRYKERDRSEAHEICITTQDYTHIDAPSHMTSGNSIDKFTVDRFVTDALLINVSNGGQMQILVNELKKFEEEIAKATSVILYTGFKKPYNIPVYDWRYLTPDSARYLASFNNLRLVGIDSPSIAGWSGTVEVATPRMSRDDAILTHVELMKNDILIVEGLYNLEAVFRGTKIDFVTGIFIVMPLNLVGLDGSPVRAIFMRFKE